VCIYPTQTEPTETCEITSVAGQEYWGDPENGMIYAPTQAIFAILFANPIQVLWDFLAVALMKWRVNKQNPVESCQFLLF
jgi:hypothetical protein